MTLNRTLLLLSLHPLLALPGLALTHHHHFFVVTLLHLTLSDITLAFAHFLFAIFAFSAIGQLSLTVHILGRVLAHGAVTKRRQRMALRLWWRLAVVGVLWSLRALGQVGDRQVMT